MPCFPRHGFTTSLPATAPFHRLVSAPPRQERCDGLTPLAA
jgi:hypothetical protein